MNDQASGIRINGQVVDASDWPTPELAAVHELLRQRASECGHVGDGDDSDAVDRAIEQTLLEEVDVPEPTAEECERWYKANLSRYRSGDLVCARHILFQITPGAPVPAIRDMAEVVLKEVRHNPEVFEDRARKHSNCPSGEHGGNLGQLGRGDTVPEFEKVLFEDESTGVLPRLVTSRHGFHIIKVDQRIPGQQLPFEVVHEQVEAELRQRSEARALTQYVRLLAARAEVEGVELDAAQSPLLQ